MINFAPVVLISTCLLGLAFLMLARAAWHLTDALLWVPAVVAVVVRIIVSLIARLMILNMLRKVGPEFVQAAREALRIGKQKDPDSWTTSNPYDHLNWMLDEYCEEAFMSEPE